MCGTFVLENSLRTREYFAKSITETTRSNALTTLFPVLVIVFLRAVLDSVTLLGDIDARTVPAGVLVTLKASCEKDNTLRRHPHWKPAEQVCASVDVI